MTAALVALDGSIDWLCLPRFDAGACFAALLGTPEHGRWLIAPAGGVRKVDRRYRPGTLVLETVFETEDGEVAIIDFMPPRSPVPELIRVVEGRRGRVPMHLELVIRFDYGSIVPWVSRLDRGLAAIAGPDRIRLRSNVELCGIDYRTVAEFTVAAGQRETFEMAWHPAHLPEPREFDVLRALEETEQWWRDWSSAMPGRG